MSLKRVNIPCNHVSVRIHGGQHCRIRLHITECSVLFIAHLDHIAGLTCRLRYIHKTFRQVGITHRISRPPLRTQKSWPIAETARWRCSSWTAQTRIYLPATCKQVGVGLVGIQNCIIFIRYFLLHSGAHLYYNDPPGATRKLFVYKMFFINI